MKKDNPVERGVPILGLAKMKTKGKTKKQLMDELVEMYKKVTELETLVTRKKQDEPARIGEELFQTLIENALEFITIIDRDGIIRYESPSVMQKTGYRLEDLIGKRIFDIVHPDDLPKAIDVYNRTIQDPDKTQSAELRTRDSYGTWRVVEARVRNLLNNPLVKGIVIHSHDITEYRQAETKLGESENLYRILTENSLTGIYLFRENRYLFANEMYSEISGYSWDDLKRMDPIDLIAPEHRKLVSERLKRRLAGEEEPSDYESQILRKDGAIRDVHIKATRIMYEGEPAALGNIIDITERKRMEEALNGERQRFQVLCDRSPIGVMMIAEDGTLKYVNPTFSKLFGYDLSDIPDGKTWLRKAYPDPAYRHDVISAWTRELDTFKKRERRHRVFSVTCKDGSKRTVDFNTVQLDAGEYSVLCEDITERERAEEALRKSEEAAKRLAQENSIMAEIGRIISSTLNIGEVYERFAEEARKLISFDGIAINIIDHKAGTVTVPYVTGMITPRAQPGDVFPLKGSVTGEVNRRHSGFIVQSEKRENIERLFPTLSGALDMGLRSLLVVPLIFKDQVIGVIHFRSLREGAYSEQNAKLGESIASQIAGAIANAQLFAERKRAEEALRESEEKYRVVVENAREVIFIAQDGMLKFINRAAEEIAGYSMEEFATRPFIDFVHPDDQKMIIKNYQKRLRGETLPPVYTFRIIDKDGKTRWVENNAVVITWNGRPAALYFARDVTERQRAEEALHKSEERFRELYDNAPVGYHEYDSEGRITNVNFTDLEMLGYTREEMIGHYIWEFNLEEKMACQQVLEKLAGLRPPGHDFERTYKRKDGTTIPVLINDRLILDENGRITGIRCTIQDITERKRAEEALRESERRLKIILQGSPISAFILDKEHKVIHWNRALEKLSGMKGEEVVGTKKHWKPFYREERPCLADLLVDGRIEEIPQWYPGKWVKSKLVEEAYEASDFFPGLGESGRWMEFTAAPIRDSSEKIVGVIETLEDITERKRAEDWLKESESRFRDLVENALTGIYIIQDGGIVYKNSEQERIFGLLPQPYNFNDFRNLYPEDVEKVKELYEKIMSGEISSFDVDIRFFAGSEMDNVADMKWVQSRARETVYQGRKAILINMMDVTRAKELEHLMRMDDKMTSLGRAAAGIIHELRNPLSGINVYLTALKKIYNRPEGIESENLEKVDEIIEKMQSASNKIEFVIKRVMDFSKPSIPRLTLTNINHSIQEAIGLSSATLRKYGIRIEASLQDDLPQCFTDSHLIEQVLLNLIMNASQAMEKTVGDKIVEVTSTVEGNSILIGVADSGPGVPPILRKKIFDPFFTTKKDSSGIGLSVCYRIVTDHGGSLNVLTSKWGGAEFKVSIPIEKRQGIR